MGDAVDGAGGASGRVHARRADVWNSVASEARPVLFAAKWRKTPRKALVVAANYDRALAWQAKLELCGVPHDAILPPAQRHLRACSRTPPLSTSPSPTALAPCGRSRKRSDKIVLASPGAALERTLPKRRAAGVDWPRSEAGRGDRPRSDAAAASPRLGYEAAEPVRIPWPVQPAGRHPRRVPHRRRPADPAGAFRRRGRVDPPRSIPTPSAPSAPVPSLAAGPLA